MKTESKNNYSRIAILAVTSTVVWIFICLFGEWIGAGSLGGNDMCIKYLGCTSGFFGYDAIEHFLFGISLIWSLIWLFKKYPQYSLLHTKLWKSVLTLIALVALVSVTWEFIECAHDYFRIDILHQTLFNFRLHINHLDQPTNLDTMGDLAFSLFGSIVALFFTKLE